MNLFLASKVRHEKTLKELEKLVGGFIAKKLVYIPTAANSEEGWEKWKNGDTYHLIKTFGFEMKVVVLEEYRTPEVIDELKGADVIWFSGGWCGYLMYWMRRTKLDINLQKLLEKEKSWYVGSSASAMVTGQSLDTAEWYWEDQEIGAGVIPALKWVDFDIYPHYTVDRLSHIKKHYKGKKLYLLKDGEAIVMKDGKEIIIGEPKILVPNGIITP